MAIPAQGDRFTSIQVAGAPKIYAIKKVPLAAVQRQTGNRSLQTTGSYLRLTVEDVKRAYEEAR